MKVGVGVRLRLDLGLTTHFQHQIEVGVNLISTDLEFFEEFNIGLGWVGGGGGCAGT